MRIPVTRATQVISVVLVIASFVMYFWANPAYVPDVRTFGVSPRLIPNLCVIAVALLAVGLFVEAQLLHRRSQKKGLSEKEIVFEREGVVLLLFSIGSMVVYQLVVYRMGYIVTVVLILSILMWLLGQRNKALIAAVALGVPFAYYLFFTQLMNMKMP